MALEQIKQAVHDTAKTEADYILKAARKSVEEKLGSARRAAELDSDRRYQAAARAVDEELARKLIQLQGAANKELLVRKNALLQGIFAQARERILGMDAAEYAAVMGRFLERAAEEHGGRLRVHPSEKSTFETLASAFNEGRAESLRVTVDDAQPLTERGGFIFVSEVFEVDQTLGTLLIDIEHELAPQIAAELFSGRK